MEVNFDRQEAKRSWRDKFYFRSLMSHLWETSRVIFKVKHEYKIVVPETSPFCVNFISLMPKICIN